MISFVACSSIRRIRTRIPLRRDITLKNWSISSHVAMHWWQSQGKSKSKADHVPGKSNWYGRRIRNGRIWQKKFVLKDCFAEPRNDYQGMTAATISKPHTTLSGGETTMNPTVFKYGLLLVIPSILTFVTLISFLLRNRIKRRSVRMVVEIVLTLLFTILYVFILSLLSTRR